MLFTRHRCFYFYSAYIPFNLALFLLQTEYIEYITAITVNIAARMIASTTVMPIFNFEDLVSSNDKVSAMNTGNFNNIKIRD